MDQHKPTEWLNRKSVVSVAVPVMFITGIILMGINVYGLPQPIRKPGLGLDDPKELRFVSESVWSYERSMQAIAQLHDISDKDEAARQAAVVVSHALVHPDWFRVDPVEYRQLVPVWENYYLHLIGRFSGLPQFERYHFSDYKRTIRRGIGLCGDAAMVMSSVLDELDIENRILSFDGHVIVEYQDSRGKWRLADPDFGVLISADIKRLRQDPESVRVDYRKAGYTEDEITTLVEIYRTPYAVFDGVYHFMTRRFIFEYVSYVMKWLIPALLLLQGGVYWYWRKQKSSNRQEGFAY